MRKKFLLPVLLISIYFLSCQQELPQIINEVQKCKITTGLYYGGSGGINDSANFIYDASGHLIKWQSEDGYYDYGYTGGNITSHSFHDRTTGELLYVDTIHYDGNNNINEIIFHMYDQSGWFSYDTTHQKMLFEYANNKLNRTILVETYDYGFGLQTDSLFTRYYWDAAGNMNKILYLDELGFAYDSSLYQFDSNPNYFKIVHPHFFLFDPEFQLHVGLEAHFPYFYSKNNVTNFNIYGSFDYPIIYGLDSINRLSTVKMGGFDYMEYRYGCE